MKKVLALLMVLALCAGVMAGCGGTPASAGTPDASVAGAESTAAPEVADGEEIVINIWDWDTGFDTGIIDRFNALGLGIKAQFNIIPDDGNQKTKLDVLAMGGGEVDVMPMADGDQFLRMQNGMIAPIDEFLAADGIDMEALYGGAADWVQYDGKYYGLPLRVNHEAIFYNKDMFDAAGLDYPADDWTYDDYIETARALTTGEGPSKVYGTYTHVWSGVWNNIGCQGALYYTEDGKCNFDNAAFRKALETRKMLDDEGTQQSYSQITAVNAMPNSAFLGGQAAMGTIGTWLLRDMKDQENFPHDFEIGWTYMPRFDENSPMKPVNSTVSMLGIPTTSKNKEAAWKFMRFYIEENAKSIAAGGNIPCYLPAYDEELINVYIEGSGLAMEYAQKIFSPDLSLSSSKVGAPPQHTYNTAPQYTTLVDEQVQLYFNGEQDLDTTVANVVANVNAMLEEEG